MCWVQLLVLSVYISLSRQPVSPEMALVSTTFRMNNGMTLGRKILPFTEIKRVIFFIHLFHSVFVYCPPRCDSRRYTTVEWCYSQILYIIDHNDMTGMVKISRENFKHRSSCLYAVPVSHSQSCNVSYMECGENVVVIFYEFFTGVSWVPDRPATAPQCVLQPRAPPSRPFTGAS